MNLTITVILLTALAGSTLTFGWLGARPRTDLTKPRMVPWQLLMMLTAAGAIMVLVHALNLIGVKTGGGQ